MKRFLLVCLCLITCLFSVNLVGCGDKNYSKDDIDSLYTLIKTDESTSQFFDGDYLSIVFDNSKVNSNSSTDKSYIFSSVYSHYLSCSSSLFSGVVERVEKVSFAVKNFQQSQMNIIYNKLNDVYSSLKNFYNNKEIFELTNGNLHYKNVISSYNSLIKKLYSFNESFAEFYFDSVGSADFSKVELSNSNIRDMISYQLLISSKVSFNYDLLNWVSSNPLGEVNSWYNSTAILKDYISSTSSTLTKLENTENLADHLGSNKTSVRQLFINMQNQEVEFDNEYSKFLQSINEFNLKSYFSSTNKNAYLLSCSNQQQSYFNVAQNFINGRYTAFLDGLVAVSNYL